MDRVIKELLSSKKFLVAIATTIVSLAMRFGADWPVEDVVTLMSPLWVWLLGQGLADFGKESLKIQKQD